MPLMKCLTGRNFVFVDVETTGASAVSGQVIEIGIIRVEDGKVVRSFETLLRPSRSISNLITQITGITNADLVGKPTFDEVAIEVQELMSDAIFVAHNARFDHGFLKNEFKRIGINWTAKTLCTVKVSRALFPTQKSHSLQNIITIHELTVSARHRALEDARAMMLFLAAAERKLGSELITQAIDIALGNHILPPNIDPQIIAKLPHSPGVYMFYDKDDNLLYIGKSVDIKKRVRSHLSQSHTSSKEAAITSNVHYIDHEVTSGELSALLRESALIKELSPIHNRRLRSTSELAVFKSKRDEKTGYLTGSLFYQKTLDIINVRNIEGLFRTIYSGKAVILKAIEEFQLCPKLLGFEKGTRGPCFQYQLGKCQGACANKEDAATYNERFSKAFEKIRLRAWPFKGAIILPEDPDALEGSAFLIDQWRILKKIDYTQEGQSETEFDNPFDYDTYRILSKHLLKKRNRIDTENTVDLATA